MSNKHNPFDQPGFTFVRYGGLSSVPQKGYSTSNKTPHSPPARKGVYAFPFKFEERFLLGKQDFDQRRMQWVRDDNKNLIQANSPEAENLYNKSNKYTSARKQRSLSPQEQRFIKQLLPHKYNDVHIRNYEQLNHILQEILYDPKRTVSSEQYDDITDNIDKILGNPNTPYVAIHTNRNIFNYDGELWHHLVHQTKTKDILAYNGSWIKTTTDVYKKSLSKFIANEKGVHQSDEYKSSLPFNTKYVNKDMLEVFIEDI